MTIAWRSNNNKCSGSRQFHFMIQVLDLDLALANFLLILANSAFSLVTRVFSSLKPSSVSPIQQSFFQKLKLTQAARVSLHLQCSHSPLWCLDRATKLKRKKRKILSLSGFPYQKWHQDKKWLTDLAEEIKHGNVSQGSEFLMYLASNLIFAAACDDDAVVKYCGLSPSNLLKTGYLQNIFFLQAPLLTGGMAKRRGQKLDGAWQSFKV